MSLSTRKLPGRIEPFRAFFGSGECTVVTCLPDSSGSLDAVYFTANVPASFFNSLKLAENYYIWFNVDGSSVDPAPAGLTGIEVSISTDDTAIAVATALESALNALSPKRFRVVRDGAVVTMENIDMGAVDATADGAAATGFDFVQASVGFGQDLGSTTSDGAEVSFSSESLDVTSLQSGSLVLDKLYLGGAIELSLGLQEMDINTWELALKTTGSSFTPAGGSQVAGIGEERLFKSFLANGGQLVLKPLSTESGDNSRNITFWRCAPLPESINYNNEIQALSVTFTSLLDSSRDSRINAFCFGDQDQEGLQ